MKVLQVPDMHCDMCVKRITKALTDEGIVFHVSLDDKTVMVEDCKVPQAIKTLDDLGFSAKE